MAPGNTFRPIRPPAYPIGTLAELKELNLDPAVVGSCSRRLAVPGQPFNAGCSAYDVCDRKEKDVAGPENYAFRLIKDEALGGGAREGCAPCYACHNVKRLIESQGGLFDFIGGPGTDYVRSETRLVGQTRSDEWKRDNPDKQVPQDIRAALYDRDHPDFGIREKVEVDCVVQPFKRPDERADLQPYLSSSRMRERILLERRQRRMDERFGISEEDIEPSELELESTSGRSRPRPKGSGDAAAAPKP